MTAYIVTSGGFRDYQIKAVCASCESAEAYIGKESETRTVDLRIEEWEVTGAARDTGEKRNREIIELHRHEAQIREVCDLCGSLGRAVANAKRNLAAYCEHLKRCTRYP